MRRDAGFTLVEVLVAITVLAVGITGSVAAFGSISRARGVAAEYDLAALLAERHLAAVTTGSDAAVSESGDFGEDHPEVTWEQEVIPTGTEGLVELRLTVRWTSGQAQREAEFATYLLQESQ